MSRCIALLLVVCLGCAGVDFQGVPQSTWSVDTRCADAVPKEQAPEKSWFHSEPDGIRYYGTSLYLLVYPDGRGNLVWQILELPDRTKLMSAHPYSYFADLDSSFQFDNGMLVGARQAADGTAVPRAVISAAMQLVTALAAAAAGGMKTAMMFDGTSPPKDQKYEVPPVHFYKIVADANGIHFRGGEACGGNLRVTLGDDYLPEQP